MQSGTHMGYIHSFRGFAILNIAAIHAFVYAILIPHDFQPETMPWLFHVNETLFHDSNIYFALISGILYSAVLKPRGLAAFYGRKLRNVLLPYLFCTMLFSVFMPPGPETGLFALRPDLGAYFSAVAHNIVWGEAQFTYWYIPVLFALFAMTPVLDRLCADARLAPLKWLVLALPLVFARPEFDPSVPMLNVGVFISTPST